MGIPIRYRSHCIIITLSIFPRQIFFIFPQNITQGLAHYNYSKIHVYFWTKLVSEGFILEDFNINSLKQQTQKFVSVNFFLNNAAYQTTPKLSVLKSQDLISLVSLPVSFSAFWLGQTLGSGLQDLGWVLMCYTKFSYSLDQWPPGNFLLLKNARNPKVNPNHISIIKDTAYVTSTNFPSSTSTKQGS